MPKIVTKTATEIKKVIPYGGIKEVAKRSNCSIFTVSRVIKGVSNNPTVVRNLAEYISELNRAKQQLNNAIDLNSCTYE